MSLSRTELEAMDRDELVETIVNLADKVDDQQARLDAMSRWKEATSTKLDRLADTNEQLREENAQLRERLDSVEATAEQAMSVASRGHNPDSRSKTEHAKAISRNLLVQRAAKGSSPELPITTSKVADVAKADGVDLKWQVIKNAWGQLCEEWPQFYETTKDGHQALSIRSSDVTQALARAVEHDLGRDDLAKRFVGQSGGAQP